MSHNAKIFVGLVLPIQAMEKINFTNHRFQQQQQEIVEASQYTKAIKELLGSCPQGRPRTANSSSSNSDKTEKTTKSCPLDIGTVTRSGKIRKIFDFMRKGLVGSSDKRYLSVMETCFHEMKDEKISDLYELFVVKKEVTAKEIIKCLKEQEINGTIKLYTKKKRTRWLAMALKKYAFNNMQEVHDTAEDLVAHDIVMEKYEQGNFSTFTLDKFQKELKKKIDWFRFDRQNWLQFYVNTLGYELRIDDNDLAALQSSKRDLYELVDYLQESKRIAYTKAKKKLMREKDNIAAKYSQNADLSSKFRPLEDKFEQKMMRWWHQHIETVAISKK